MVSQGIESDIAVLNRWWIEHASDVPQEAVGLWFGIADIVARDGTTRCTMYVAATADFDPNDGGDWASDYVWEPPDRYLELDGLAAIGAQDWVNAVEHAVAVVQAVRPWETAPQALRGVGVGFDDGDVHIVWNA